VKKVKTREFYFVFGTCQQQSLVYGTRWRSWTYRWCCDEQYCLSNWLKLFRSAP